MHKLMKIIILLLLLESCSNNKDLAHQRLTKINHDYLDIDSYNLSLHQYWLICSNKQKFNIIGKEYLYDSSEITKSKIRLALISLIADVIINNFSYQINSHVKSYKEFYLNSEDKIKFDLFIINLKNNKIDVKDYLKFFQFFRYYDGVYRKKDIISTFGYLIYQEILYKTDKITATFLEKNIIYEWDDFVIEQFPQETTRFKYRFDKWISLCISYIPDFIRANEDPSESDNFIIESLIKNYFPSWPCY